MFSAPYQRSQVPQRRAYRQHRPSHALAIPADARTPARNVVLGALLSAAWTTGIGRVLRVLR